ncbi:hypothetical protein KC851_02215, partial [Candidatus Kaiserbacteria bacterium]|nr:hypothetical protein [Candidatus Kaiserbacteria bacterium]
VTEQLLDMEDIDEEIIDEETEFAETNLAVETDEDEIDTKKTELESKQNNIASSTETDEVGEVVVVDDNTASTTVAIDENSNETTPNSTSTTTNTVGGSQNDEDIINNSASSTEETEETGSSSGSTSSADEEKLTDSNDIEEENLEEENIDEATDESDDLIDSEQIEKGVNDLVDGVVNEVVTLARQLVTEENYFQFSKQSCVAVGDGTFHCSNKSVVPVDTDNAVFADKDADGDMEIYMRTTKGELKQLSDNDYDDTAPHLDLVSMRVVWQRMIQGRYQVISYDLETRQESQLTFSRTNNMDPKSSKEGIVWQAWDGNDWEIMFFDGEITDQITDNDIQDVTPVIEDGYILWSILGGEKSEARVYSLESGEIMTITGHEGGAVANPRFVLVYDTKFDNGDVVTQGFDPETGLSAPIAAKPADLPFDIPESDPVGEIRALIQNKSTQKDKDVVTIKATSGDGELDLATSTATSSDTLNISNPSLDDIIDSGSPTTTEEFVLTDFDLVITKTASSAPSEINEKLIEVPDILVGEFIATSTQD